MESKPFIRTTSVPFQFWRCDRCGAANNDTAYRCFNCRTARLVDQILYRSPLWYTPQVERRDRMRASFLAVAAIVVAVAISTVLYFYYRA